MPPLVSVIIPTHNRRRFIAETVASVLAQTHRDLEVIVVDDGSTDGTRELLQQRFESEPRCRYIWQKNSERAVARNTGIKAAQGEFLAFLDSDDLWLPTKLEQQLAVFAAQPDVVLVHSAWMEVDEAGTKLRDIVRPDARAAEPGSVFAKLLAGNLIASPTPVARRQAFDSVGMFNENPRLLCFEDWEMWTRLASVGPVAFVATPLASRRLHPGNTERTLGLVEYDAFVSGVLGSVNKKLRSLARTLAAPRYAKLVCAAMKSGQASSARRHYFHGWLRLGMPFLKAMSVDHWLLARLLVGWKISTAARAVLAATRGRPRTTD